MLQFIVTNLLLLSLGLIVYLSVRSLPRIDVRPKDQPKRGLAEMWLASEMPEKIDIILNTFLGKVLRRLKVFLLKVDNTIGERLKKIKDENSKNGELFDRKQVHKITDIHVDKKGR